MQRVRALLISSIAIICLVQPAVAETWQNLLNRAESLIEAGQTDSAKVVVDRAVALAESQYGRSDSTVDIEFYREGIFARYYYRSFAQAESLYTQVVSLKERLYGEVHPEVATMLLKLGEAYKRSMTVWEAERCFDRALTIRQSALPAGSRDIILALSALGAFYERNGKLKDSESMLMRALSLAELMTPVDSTVLSTIVNDLGFTLLQRGRYADGERYCRRAIAIMQKIFDPANVRFGNAWLNLAWCCEATGKVEEAGHCYEKALHVMETEYGANGREVSRALNFVGLFLYSCGRYDVAMRCYQRARDIVETKSQKWPFDIATACNNLAEVYNTIGRYRDAEDIAVKAIRVMKEITDSNHYAYAYFYRNLALSYQGQDRYDEAEQYYLKALALGERVLSPQHPEVALCLQGLGRFYAETGDNEKSIEYYHRYLSERQRLSWDVFAYSSELDKLRWVRQYPLLDNSLLSLGITNPGDGAAELSLQMLFRGKAAVVEAVMAERQAAYCSYDDRIMESLSRHREVCTQIAGMAVAGGLAGDEALSLLSQKDSLEADLNRRCAEFGDELAIRDVTCTDVSSALSETTLLCEFIEYRPYDFTVSGGEQDKIGLPRYAVLTLNHAGNTTMTDLGDAAEIDSLILLAREMMYDDQAQVYSKNAVEAEKKLDAVTSRLYDLVFAPVAAKCEGKTEFYVSPDGLLNLLPFEILPMGDSSYVIEKYRISYLSSGRDLLRYRRHLEPGSGAIVFADPNFEQTMPTSGTLPYNTANRTDPTPYYPVEPFRGVESCLGVPFGPLRYSREEGQVVAGRFEKTSRDKVVCYYGNMASEDNLKNMANTPRVLHLATHGYFCAEVEDSTSGFENPLLRSGLLMAGANRTLKHTEKPTQNGEDGVLTAFEVSALDLMGTELVTLSACESGVGEVVSGEGLFGLRRAFQHAGAQSILMSLWKVPDRETKELMDGFYRRWLAGTSKGEALRESALELLRKSRSERGHGHPLLWGGFIMAGNPD